MMRMDQSRRRSWYQVVYLQIVVGCSQAAERLRKRRERGMTSVARQEGLVRREAAAFLLVHPDLHP